MRKRGTKGVKRLTTDPYESIQKSVRIYAYQEDYILRHPEYNLSGDVQKLLDNRIKEENSLNITTQPPKIPQ